MQESCHDFDCVDTRLSLLLFSSSPIARKAVPISLEAPLLSVPAACPDRLPVLRICAWFLSSLEDRLLRRELRDLPILLELRRRNLKPINSKK